jgi:hypothetical protein
MRSIPNVLQHYPVTEHKLGHVPTGFEPMNVVRWTEEGEFLSRWQFTTEELERINETGEIFVFHHADGSSRILPIRMQVERPTFTLPVIHVEHWAEAADSAGHIFDGMEVLRAGGTEDERYGFAVDEAADLIHMHLGVPVRLNILRDDFDWMEGGGTLVERVEQLQAAILDRLERLAPGLRVEARDVTGKQVLAVARRCEQLYAE